MLDPGEDHSAEQNVEDGKKPDGQQCPRSEAHIGRTYSQELPCQPEEPQCGGNIQSAVDHPHQKVCRVTHWKAQQGGGVKVLSESGCHHWKKLPEEKNNPERHRKPLQIAMVFRGCPCRG